MRGTTRRIVALIVATLIHSTGAQAGDTSKFMAVGTYAEPTAVPEASLALSEERETMKMYLNGKVEQFWFRKDGKGVVLLMAAESLDEAASLLRGLPFAKTNAIRFEILPVGPMMPFFRLLDDGLVHGP
ncbi:hypothetical protein [Tardiphaga sp.]|uniref:hypothetical protein n=1 Tax=Tardiphaga sp. TaxID=1926292 RepID=UPI0026106398|nr:hypothetical protein [Tardiphaga sp.]MDB5620409.1 hypothetical protein [Tardiphaga sp.]